MHTPPISIKRLCNCTSSSILFHSPLKRNKEISSPRNKVTSSIFQIPLMDSSRTSFKILMFPWLAHGHIFPYLELAKRILKRKNFHIYLCSTPINSNSINNFIQSNSLQSSIEFVELYLQHTPELPPHYHTTKNLPSSLNFTLLKAFQTADSSFSNIINNIKPDLLIFDGFQPWSAKQALSQGIPAVHFSPFGAASYSVLQHRYLCKDSRFPFPELILPGAQMKTMDKLMEFLSVNVFNGEKYGFFMNLIKLSSDIVLMKTIRGFEGKYIDYYSSVVNKKIVPVGPLVKDENTSDEQEEGSEIIEWLSKKNEHSTVYISFGSEYFLSKEEMGEVAKGLEICGVNFIWVVRFPVGEKMDTKEALPEGFLERVKERGVIVEGWAPQAKILAHRSVGGFLSHCGWSSVNESIYYGAPIIGIPFKLNMVIDSRLVAEEGAGVEVARDENKVYKGEEIAEAIKKVILEESGEGIRRKVRQISDAMKMEQEQELDEAAEELWQLCLKRTSVV